MEEPLTQASSPLIRAALDGDAASIIEVIDAVYHEYGDVMDLDGYDRDLRSPATSYETRRGVFVVLELSGRILGTHGALPLDEATHTATFRRLYLHPLARGDGNGRRLMQWTVDWASARGFRRVEIWSDIRFEHAHRFFERFGFVRGEVRPATARNPYDEYAFSLATTSTPG